MPKRQQGLYPSDNLSVFFENSDSIHTILTGDRMIFSRGGGTFS